LISFLANFRSCSFIFSPSAGNADEYLLERERPAAAQRLITKWLDCEPFVACAPAAAAFVSAKWAAPNFALLFCSGVCVSYGPNAAVESV